MPSLAAFLEAQSYRRIPLTRNGVGHFEAAGSLNGRAIHVLIDTGAANTVVNHALAVGLGLVVRAVEGFGGGAGGVNLEIFQVEGADLWLGDMRPRAPRFIAMDLAHVNAALAMQAANPVDVILGVDVFDAQAAIIDYGSSSLFLRDI